MSKGADLESRKSVNLSFPWLHVSVQHWQIAIPEKSWNISYSLDTSINTCSYTRHFHGKHLTAFVRALKKKELVWKPSCYFATLKTSTSSAAAQWMKMFISYSTARCVHQDSPGFTQKPTAMKMSSAFFPQSFGCSELPAGYTYAVNQARIIQGCL